MKKLWLLLVLALLLCGCGAEPDPDAVDLRAAPAISVEEVSQLPVLQHSGYGTQSAPYNIATAEDGLFVSEDADYGLFRRIYFAEFDSGEIYPLCARVNCSHDTEDCSAMAYGWHYYFDGTYFYHVSTWNSANDYLVRQRADGSDQEIVFRTAKESNKPTTIISIDTIVYEGNRAYFTMNGTYFDQETEAVSSGERIGYADLTTGALTVIPLKFGDGKGSSDLQLKGKYGDNLVVVDTSRTSLLKEEYAVTGFLLDINTQEITILYTDSYSDKEPSAIDKTFAIGDGFIILDDGSKKIIDLEQEVCYSLADSTIQELWVLDGNWIYTVDGSGNLVRSISTGEAGTWPEDMPDLDFSINGNHPSLDYYIVHMEDNGQWNYAVIGKSDFWAGNWEFLRFSDWALF